MRRARAATTGASLPVLVPHMDPVGQPGRVRHWAALYEAQIRKTVQQFLDWAARSGIQPRNMQGAGCRSSPAGN